jgi:exo-1,4-beta-D-glucosaminidase
VDTETLKSAALTVTVQARNETAAPVSGELSGDIGPIHFSKKVSLAAGETALVKFAPEDFPALALKNPRLWWPHDLGKPELYTLALKFTSGGAVSDSRSLKFGVRQVSDYLTPEGYRGYRVNGRPILIRGGGWTDEILLRQTPERVRAQVAYAAHMGLNTLRLESFWGEDEELYKACDEAGILIMAGWSCQWEWPEYLGKPTDENFGGIRSPEDVKLISASWQDHVLWLRNHPALLVWLYGSDMVPGPDLEAAYQAILKTDDPSRPFLASAAGKTSALTGPTGVKMLGPYDYVPPSYWFSDKTHGGAFGFNTETGPGPQVPVKESLERMLGKDHLWPIDDTWLYHTARHEFYGLTRFNEAMDAKLGKPADLNDYERKAQLLNYDGMRGMFEAFNANKPAATGIIQWMFNASWPKLWWQLFDYYLAPTGAFYGARKANGPLHAVYNQADGGVYLVTRGLEGYKGVTVELKTLDIASAVTQRQSATLDIGGNQALRVTGLGAVTPPGKTYFLDLRVKNGAGKLLDSNFYALSSVPDVLDEAKYTWAVTPVSSHGDLTALAALPQVKLSSEHRYGAEPAAGRRYVEVTLANPSKQLAFSIELELYKAGTGELLTPVFWDDNFVTLLPGEKRLLRAYYSQRDAGKADPELKVRGWNVK